MLPFYIFCSAFGYRRIGDLVWAAGDSRCRGFLIGATAGRTTLSGEGLQQHQDGSSHLLFSVVPNCVAYDPCYGYELAAIVQDGMRRMLEDQEDVFYYVTVTNENYVHPAMPEGAQEGILRGLYRLRLAADRQGGPRVQLLGAGTLLREALAAAELLEEDWGVAADVWSVTSFTELRRDGLDAERRNRLHPSAVPDLSWVEQCLAPTAGPVVAVSDYLRTVPDLIRAWVPRRYVTLGTDGYGRSDTRAALRRFFEVDRHHIAVAALKAVADDGSIEQSRVEEAIARYGIDTGGPNPWDC
jgi:pyruvate dehydrogenase E1 component